MDKDREVNLRSAVPMSDEEILEIWNLAVKGEKKELHLGSDFLIIWSVCGTALLAFMLTRISIASNPPTTIALTVAIFAIWSIGYLKHARNHRPKVDEPVDVNNPRVLQTVIEYVAEEPIARAEKIKSIVALERTRISMSLPRLQEIISNLSTEVRQTREESLRLMIASKKESAEDAYRQLVSADSELEARFNEADSAVRPVVEMVSKFQTLWQLSSDIEDIRAAFSLAEHAAETAENQKFELTYLQAVSHKAVVHLSQIEASLNSGNRARLEVRALVEDKKGAFETLFAHPKEIQQALEDRASED